MKYTEEDCKRDTLEHIEQVKASLKKIVYGVVIRGRDHDASKLESPELEIFTEYTPKLAETTYGSEEYKECLKEMQVALDHHYENNSHHPEFYSDGIKGMDLLDLIEMFADWKAATMRHNDGDLAKSIEINQKRFGYSDDLKAILINSVKLLD